MKITLTFEIDVDGDRTAALDRRDEIIDMLKRHGIDLVLTDDGTRIVMYDHGEKFGTGRNYPSPTQRVTGSHIGGSVTQVQGIEAARDAAAERNARMFGTDPSWYGR